MGHHRCWKQLVASLQTNIRGVHVKWARMNYKWHYRHRYQSVNYWMGQRGEGNWSVSFSSHVVASWCGLTRTFLINVLMLHLPGCAIVNSDWLWLSDPWNPWYCQILFVDSFGLLPHLCYYYYVESVTMKCQYCHLSISVSVSYIWYVMYVMWKNM